MGKKKRETRPFPEKTPDNLKRVSYNHLYYEIRMLLVGGALLTKTPVPETIRDRVVRNALEEAYAVHLRIIVHFLYRRPKEPSDVTASDYVRDLAAWEQSRGDMPELLKNALSRANTEVAHLTTIRLTVPEVTKDWQPEDITPLVIRVLRLFLHHADSQRLHVENIVKAINSLDEGLESFLGQPSRRLPHYTSADR